MMRLSIKSDNCVMLIQKTVIYNSKLPDFLNFASLVLELSEKDSWEC